MGKTKITVTIDESVIKDLDRLSEQRRESRSRLVEEAVKAWRNGQMEKALIEGYQAMAQEDVATAEFHLHIARENLT